MDTLNSLKYLFKNIGLGLCFLFMSLAKIYLFLLFIVNLANLFGTKHWKSETTLIESITTYPTLYTISYPHVDTDLVPYVMFAEQLIEKKINYSVVFGDLTYPNIGLCINIPGIYTEITIDKDFWYGNTCYYAKEEVFLHEVGHCSLYRLHDKSVMFGQYTYSPASIMTPNAFGCTDHYKKNRQHFLRELVSK